MRGLNRGRLLAGTAPVLGLALGLAAQGLTGDALAQKPAPLGAPAPAQGGKPPPAGAMPAPAPAPVPMPAPMPAPAPQAVDKFGQTAPPSAPPAPPPQVDKFGQAPQGATPAPGLAPAPAPQQAAPATPPPSMAAPIPPPANEPETVQLFRRLLGADTQLSYGSAEVVDPTRGAVRMQQVVLQRPDRRAAIAEMTLDGLREDGVTEALLRGVLMEETGGNDTVRIERVRIAGLGVTRPAAGQEMRPDMLSVDSLRIEGLAVQGDTPVSIASLTVEDYGRGRPGRLAMEGLEVRQPGEDPVDRVSLGRLTLRGMDMAAVFAALVAKEAPPRTTGSAALEAEDLVLGKGDRTIGGLAGITLSGDAPAAGSSGVETGRLSLRGISVQPFPGLDSWMQRFGYSSLVGDMTADVRVDRAAQRLEIGSLSLAARDIGALGFSMVLDGVAAGETDPAALARARLVSMRLRFVDQSLYGRFVRMQAQESRRSEQQVREEFAAQARAVFDRPSTARPGPGGKGSGSGGGGTATADIGNAVQRFLRGQAREIEISAQPPQPIPFEQLQGVAPAGPDALQQALGLTVTTR